MKLYRCRFFSPVDDCRPVNWPIKHPYWITGTSGDGRRVIVAYANDEQYILDNWPEAEDIDMQEVDGYSFTSRFTRPSWFEE